MPSWACLWGLPDGDIADKDMATPGRDRAPGKPWLSRIGEKERFMLLIVAPAASVLILFQIVPIFIGADAQLPRLEALRSAKDLDRLGALCLRPDRPGVPTGAAASSPKPGRWAKPRGFRWIGRPSSTLGNLPTMPWTNVDDIHRAKLEELLVEFGVTGWPKGLRPDRQRPLVERLGLRVVALGNTATFITMIYLIAAPLGNLFDPVKRRGTGISQ